MLLKYLTLFLAIQLASLILTVLGLPIVGFLSLAHAWDKPSSISAQWHWVTPLAWLWDNEEDGVCAPGATPTVWSTFYWSALRNPCNNLRFVRGVSLKGRPLWRKTWGPKPGGWYAQAGWSGSGWPVLSAGRNVNTW